MGARSRAAAQILAGQGFKAVYNFKGGIQSWNGHSVAGSATIEMTLLNGDEHPTEIVSVAYRMEMALGQFYATVAGNTDDPEVSALLTRLADIEMTHKDHLFGLYQSLVGRSVDRPAFESEMVPNIMEGGLTIEEFETQNRSAMQSTAEVLSLAMMLEAQAMDLCLRYAHERIDPEEQKILFHIADEEKAHLSSLGALLEQKI